MKDGIEAEIDRLYQVPLDEFTAARNALAKESGKRGAEIRALSKPPLAAWAVNQLHWKRRPVYDALMTAAEGLRRAHAAVLGGRAADVRAPGKEHDERVGAALEAALDILRESGHPTTDATRQAIVTTLRALPADEPAGRLTRTLQPGGFEALAGLSIRGAKAPAILKPAAKPAKKPPAAKKTGRDMKAWSKAQEAVMSATRALKAAEHTAQREEFERARAARDEEKATKAVDAARKAIEEAEEELRSAEAAAAAANKKKESAERRVRDAEDAVERAMTAVADAQHTLDGLED
jgi:hypothetical protein